MHVKYIQDNSQAIINVIWNDINKKFSIYTLFEGWEGSINPEGSPEEWQPEEWSPAGRRLVGKSPVDESLNKVQVNEVLKYEVHRNSLKRTTIF